MNIYFKWEIIRGFPKFIGVKDSPILQIEFADN